MRALAGLAVAAFLVGSVPAWGQMRRVTVRRAAPPARPAMLPNRSITYTRPARPPVRVVDVPAARGVPPSSRPPVVGTTPVSPAAVPTTLPANPDVNTLGGAPISLGQLLNPAPGLGFDFNHLAAINRDLAVRAIIDPLTQHELALTESLPREQPVAFFGGYGGFGEYAAAPVVVAPAQPQVIVVRQPVPQAAPAARAAAQPAPAAAAPPQPPLPDVGQFLLVRRDGKVIHAVAFSVEGKRVIYITADGLRRSIALDQLNTRVTEERNAERGTILHLTD